ncbi:MAG: Ribonucleotide reductase of class II (coenzyme B12-dependent), partial [uncultured Blastococcus sp.]
DRDRRSPDRLPPPPHREGSEPGQGPQDQARLHHRRCAPLRRGDLGAPRRRHDQLARRLHQLRAARRRVPRRVEHQRHQHRHH